jgi:hypothetical protein
MWCIICYNSLVLNLNANIQVRKKLITYNTINDITTLKKTCKFKSL